MGIFSYRFINYIFYHFDLDFSDSFPKIQSFLVCFVSHRYCVFHLQCYFKCDLFSDWAIHFSMLVFKFQNSLLVSQLLLTCSSKIFVWFPDIFVPSFIFICLYLKDAISFVFILSHFKCFIYSIQLFPHTAPHFDQTIFSLKKSFNFRKNLILVSLIFIHLVFYSYPLCGPLTYL